jgi:diaminohydroxyphosphoribosylaminopyrimidine deaminase / 5-amino-6-(5-phosphoribosylamino)uracil reductase
MDWLFLWCKVMKNVSDWVLLNETIRLAQAVDYLDVRPNPRVGALIVSEGGDIISNGCHKEWGGPHAEVLAIQGAIEYGADLSTCTLYVSLEPCSHHGKTPPCTDLILKHRIPRVVYASKDPNPKVNGLELLLANGVNVSYLPLQEARSLNKEFFTHHLLKRPYCNVKMAQCADGYVAAKKNTFTSISNKNSKEHMHRYLRTACDAILSTAKTVIIDNATLNVRLGEIEKEHTAIIVDQDLKIINEKKLKIKYKRVNSKLILVTDLSYKGPARVDDIEIIVTHFKDRKVNTAALLLQLHEQFQIHRILVEAGPTFVNDLFERNCVDEYHLYTADFSLKGDEAIPGISKRMLNGAKKTSELSFNGDRYEAYEFDRIQSAYKKLTNK